MFKLLAVASVFFFGSTLLALHYKRQAQADKSEAERQRIEAKRRELSREEFDVIMVLKLLAVCGIPLLLIRNPHPRFLAIISALVPWLLGTVAVC